jgi:hypothetical protein
VTGMGTMCLSCRKRTRIRNRAIQPQFCRFCHRFSVLVLAFIITGHCVRLGLFEQGLAVDDFRYLALNGHPCLALHEWIAAGIIPEIKLEVWFCRFGVLRVRSENREQARYRDEKESSVVDPG